MALLLLLFFHKLLNYLQYKASPFYKIFLEKMNSYIQQEKLYIIYIVVHHFQLCIACNYLHMFECIKLLSSYCWHFTALLHPVMGTWIARLMYHILWWVLGLLGLLGWPAGSQCQSCTFTDVFSWKETLFHKTFGQPADTACISHYYVKFNVLLFYYIDLLYTTWFQVFKYIVK